MISRRNFLRTVPAALAAAGAFRSALAWADSDEVVIPGKEGMIVRSQRFLDLEMPLEYMNAWITPTPHFFVRNHMHEPSVIDAGDWQLSIGGEVEKPLKLSLADLKNFESHSVTNALECAGNGRAFQQPRVPGVQWQKGAVGNARFTGPRLCDLLQRAGVKTTGKHVMFRGLDEVPGKVPPFVRSIPIEKADDGDTLVALQMNGEELPKHHGFPARALVPGWIGSASCKWLTEITVLEKEAEGNFMKPAYRWPNHPGKPGEAVNPDDTHALTALSVKSLIVSPIAGSVSHSRTVSVHGVAWAGEADIEKVEISVDAGASWKPASLGHDHAKYAWRLWKYSWKAPKAGDYTILSRATDSQGRVQPASAEWNPSGYLYNAIDQVKISVQA
jgi:sulfite oxidase